MVKLKKKRPMSYKFTDKIARAYDQEEESVVIPDYVDSLMGQYGSTLAPTPQDVIEQNFNDAFNNNGGGFVENVQDALGYEETDRGHQLNIGPVYLEREGSLHEVADPKDTTTQIEVGIKIEIDP